MKYYYALFNKNNSVIEVVFPDLEGCVTFGDDWEEALINAQDVLAGWLAHAERKFVKEPSRHDDLKHLQGDLVPIQVNEKIVSSYKQLKRFNVILPVEILKRIDAYRKQVGIKRSTFIQKAAEEYLQQHK